MLLLVESLELFMEEKRKKQLSNPFQRVEVEITNHIVVYLQKNKEEKGRQQLYSGGTWQTKHLSQVMKVPPHPHQ